MKKKRDSVFGELNLENETWTGNISLENMDAGRIIPLRININYTENEKASFQKLREIYPDIKNDIYDKCVSLINKQINDSNGHGIDLEGISGSENELKNTISLFAVEIVAPGDTIKLFYEGGYHSEYLVAVELKDNKIRNISFS